MRVLAFVYDSGNAPAHVADVLDRLADREEVVDRVDVAGDGDRRGAVLTIKDGVGIGSMPDGLYDEDGSLDLSPGALVTEASNGRRSLHVGEDALTALRESDAERSQ